MSRFKQQFEQDVKQSGYWHNPNTILVSLAFLVGLILFIGGVAFWMSTSQLEESITARGEMVPQGKLRRVMAPIPGIVSAVHVGENDTIEKGQLLFELNPQSTNIEEDTLMVQRAQLEDEIDTLNAALNHNRLSVSDTAFGSIQQQWIAATRQAMTAELEAAERSIERFTQELAEAQAQQQQTQNLLTIQKKRQGDYQALFNKGGLSRNELRQIEQEVTGAEGELNRLEKTILSRQETLAEAKLNPTQIKSRYSQRLLDRLGDLQQQLSLIDRDLDKATLMHQHQQIMAPESGVIHELALRGVDEVVGTGDVLVSMVPDSAALVAEVQVPNTDLSFININQDAFITLDAFPVYEFGRVDGKVTSISPSTIKDSNGYPFYIVRIEPAKTQLAHLNSPDKLQNLKPGMTVTANLITRNKNLLSFFIEPVTTHLKKAFQDPSTRN